MTEQHYGPDIVGDLGYGRGERSEERGRAAPEGKRKMRGARRRIDVVPWSAVLGWLSECRPLRRYQPKHSPAAEVNLCWCAQ